MAIATVRVLILDDVPDNADSLGMLVRLWGYEPLIAYSGEAALELAGRHPPDVALLDLGLPRLSGFEVARRLRQRPELEATALVALTGHADMATRQRALESGFEAVLVKPVDPAALEELLQLYAGQALAQDPASRQEDQEVAGPENAEPRCLGQCRLSPR